MNGRTNSNGVGTDTLQVPLDPPVNLTATAGNAKVSLTWEDPVDKYATPEGETAQDPQQLVSKWDYTVVVRKVGSQPNDPNDGTVVTKSSIRNQYQTSPYEDTGLINDTVYFYGVFAVNKDGVASDGCISDSVIPKAGVPVSTLSTGTIIKINENGAPVEYIIIQQGKPHETIYKDSCDGTWVLRKDIESKSNWTDTFPYPNTYAGSFADEYLNNDFLTRFDSTFNNIIKTVSIPYYNYIEAWDESKIIYTTCKAFLLAALEVGLDNTLNHFPIDGAILSYFEYGGNATANAKRIAYYNGNADDWWLRSPRFESEDFVYYIRDDGTEWRTDLLGSGTEEYGIRPAFIISPDSIIDIDMILVPN